MHTCKHIPVNPKQKVIDNMSETVVLARYGRMRCIVRDINIYKRIEKLIMN